MPLALRYAVRSDVGLLREGNEDSAYAGPHLLAVADGMGGYAAGEVASSAVISAIAGLDLQNVPEPELGPALAKAVATAKNALREIVDSDPAVGSMGTTLTAMLMSGGTIALCHIGWSTRAGSHRMRWPPTRSGPCCCEHLTAGPTPTRTFQCSPPKLATGTCCAPTDCPSR